MAEGQFLGAKARYIYSADDGREFVRLADTTLAAIAGTDNVAAPAGGAADGQLPRRFFPRGVWWEGTLGGKVVRKFLVCGTAESPLYASVTRTALSVDGVAGFVTGRRGERATL